MKAPILISVTMFHKTYRKTNRGSKAATGVIKELANMIPNENVGDR